MFHIYEYSQIKSTYNCQVIDNNHLKSTYTTVNLSYLNHYEINWQPCFLLGPSGQKESLTRNQ